MRTAKYQSLPVQQAHSRLKFAPCRSELAASVRLIAGRTESQTVQIINAMIGNAPGLTPLPEIARIAAMYPPRISEGRKILAPHGLSVQCYLDTVKAAGRKSVNSWYRIEYGHAVTEEPESGNRKSGENLHQQGSALAIPMLERCSSPAKAMLPACAPHSSMLAWETGRRRR